MDIIEFLREIGVSGFFDIAFMSLLIYTLLVLFKRTHAGFILTGIVIIAVVYLLARQFNLVLTASVLQAFFAIILVAIIIIFQEEIRHFFEQIAVWSLNPQLRRKKPVSLKPIEIAILVRTLQDLANKNIGALIVIPGKNLILRHLYGGVDLKGELSEPLLKSLFDPHSPGHDGAVVVENGLITKFSCHLPLSKNFEKLKHRGTRHAAALGLAELTDALCLVVSEERGTISVARNGDLRQIGGEQLNLLLERFYEEINPPVKAAPWYDIFRRNYKEKVIAFVLTIALWFVFVYGSNLQYKTFIVPVEHSELPSGYKVTEVEPEEVKVTFVGPRRNFYFFNEREIRLFLPITDVSNSVETVTISESNFSFPQDISLESIVPRRVTVRIEKKASQ
ncbi:MAG TPA: diadenylate cyclase [Thermodesulfobacteriota bacterium]|nr:diadenylate cyclase [Thermodesulfobacteriota bacterium]